MQKTAGRKPPLSARRVHLGFAALFGAAALAAASSASATTYKYTQIDWLGATRTEAYGINDTGQIVGTSYDGMGSHGFLRTGGTFTPVDVPAGTHTAAEGINSAGQIVGSYYDSTGIQHGFLDSGGSFSRLDWPGAAVPEAFDINNKGQIVGYFNDSKGRHGFLATPSGTVIGDPWFTTFDGRSYGFQGVGEYTLARSTRDGDPFDVQIRTSSWAEHPGRSMVAAVAADLCGHRASFDLDRANAGDSLVSIDDLPSSLSRGDPVLLGDCKITETSAGTYEAIWGTGEILEVSNSRDDHLNISSCYSPFLGPGSVEGLLTSSANPDQWRVGDPTSLFGDPPAALDAAAAAVPEPATLTLLGIALLGFGIIRLPPNLRFWKE